MHGEMTAACEAIEIDAMLLQKPHVQQLITRPPRVCYQKWVMLAILSVLSAVNQAICYSYAPISSIVEERWGHRLQAESLITVYFISYIPSAFIGSWIMDRKGLSFGVILGGFLQAIGAGLRYVACFLDPSEEIYVTMLGQLLASLAMPFMVNSPPLLSANWFPSSMRATATSTALNANALGAAIVFLTAPFIVRSSQDIPMWNLINTLVAFVSCVIAFVYFRSAPTPGDRQFPAVAISKMDAKYKWSQWWTAFKCAGFWHTIVAFSVAECVINALTALLGKFLGLTSFSKTQVGIIGAAFIVSSLVGGQIISVQVDKKRSHRMVTLVCLLLTAIATILFRVVPKVEVHATLVTLMVLGAVLGPIQPIVLELGVECAYPTSEPTVAALQQLCGNFLSAIAVPGLSALQRSQFGDRYFFASPEWIMAIVTMATFIIFCF
ncbi:Solute carrier family 49 member A3 [Phytophthora citrophthora]|uniref:Solute carrier family 49 member A3 n=1 Tax=Phytophthora citrophthora TaxID=4793 RepID=A0AAD9LHM1_9STRA|nr:Solute carrier family 49 member A3 [Phytophthora citrophthora]